MGRRSVASNADGVAPATVVTTGNHTGTVADTRVVTSVTPKVSVANLSTVTVATNTDAAATLISPASIAGSEVVVAGDPGSIDESDEKVLATVTKNIPAAQFANMMRQMKVKGCDRSVTEKAYNARGILTFTSGSIQSPDGHTHFVASDFDQLILAKVRKGDRAYFKMSVKDPKKVVI